ncbi:MAG: glutamine-synthetase adenylyltransferase [Bryobacteraceae bacterium]
MQRLIEAIAFLDPARARIELAQLATDGGNGVVQRMESMLAAAPDPDQALFYLASLKQKQPAAFQSLTPSAPGLQYLVAVFAHSRFLAEELLENPQWMDQLLAAGDLDRTLTAEEYRLRLEEFAGAGKLEPLTLALYRRRQILRILLRDVLGQCALPEATEELSNLADAILEVTYQRIRGELLARHGQPMGAGADGTPVECGFAVIALGKLGGRELNYSSDIDLMFVYGAPGETTGPEPVTNKEFYQKAANRLTDLLSTYTSEGLGYRVDLRLRPDGSLGEVCISLEAAKNYYQSRARDWELQMMIKARVAAGDPLTGRELLEFVEPLTYSTTLDFSAVEALSATRERISEKLAARNRARSGKTGLDVKLARGGIRDIEFLVQCLQRLHGGRVPWVRRGGTMLALGRLHDKDLLSPGEYSRLSSAYQFLRNLEHRLQYAEDRQTHTLPAGVREMEVLARKMGIGTTGDAAAGAVLAEQVRKHLEEVAEIYERVIHAQRPVHASPTAEAPTPAGEPNGAAPATAGSEVPPPAPSNLVRFLDQRAPALAAAIGRANLRRGRRSFEHFLEEIFPHNEWLDWLEADQTLDGYVFDLFEHSPFFAEQFIRTPELLEELRAVAGGEPAAPPPRERALVLDDPADLRRYYRREMVRIQCESLCLRTPVFETLARTSELADAAVAASYRMALRQTLETHPPEAAGYRAEGQMMVIALGRLGMREFDLASDADLLFVAPDADRGEQLFWTRVAGRMIGIITAYTGDGVMFTVDTRLRPNGREGALVQSESNYQEYFEKNAEAWEGIAYMKSRAVAGDLGRATEFLNRLQQVDWRRYGQSGRSRKDLGPMRMRLEKEQGAENPLKAGRGGYYDIDFALMYLRLKGAGMFFTVLNTPERIDIIEKMGHLERSDAEFLRGAATFYRSVDHGLRLFSGHAEGSLPNSESQLETLTGLVSRWTPDHLRGQPLQQELARIQERTREFFDRIFG